ncbi:conserved hypothetical protein [Legionella longbeachae D-4968]|nr:conserved hypothetical protein [Legionella longbeachae D-4968]
MASYQKLEYQFHLSNAVEITPRFNIAFGEDDVCLVKTDTNELQSVVLCWGKINREPY